MTAESIIVFLIVGLIGLLAQYFIIKTAILAALKQARADSGPETPRTVDLTTAEKWFFDKSKQNDE